MKMCTQCGKPNVDAAINCLSCGGMLADTDPTEGETPDRMDQPPIEAAQKEAYIDILTLSVPTETMWQPLQATQLMANLFAVSDLKLQISAEAHQIRWCIEVPHYVVEIIKKAFQAQYPAVQVKVQPKTTTCIGYRMYSLEAVRPFVAPLKFAADVRQGAPLTTLVGMMAGLGPDEHLVYEMAIASPTQDYLVLGEELITESVVSVDHYLTLGGAIEATTAKMQGTDRVDKFRPEDQEVLRHKLSRTLADVKLAVKVKAATEEQALKLFLALLVGLEPMANEPFNWLYPAEEETYPLVLSPEEAAAMWHLPTQGCRAPGIVWADQTSSSFEMFDLPDDFYASPGEAHGQQAGTLEDLEAMIFNQLDDEDDLSESDSPAES